LLKQEPSAQRPCAKTMLDFVCLGIFRSLWMEMWEINSAFIAGTKVPVAGSKD
jgi:hypothetical protein